MKLKQLCYKQILPYNNISNGNLFFFNIKKYSSHLNGTIFKRKVKLGVNKTTYEQNLCRQLIKKKSSYGETSYGETSHEVSPDQVFSNYVSLNKTSADISVPLELCDNKIKNNNISECFTHDDNYKPNDELMQERLNFQKVQNSFLPVNYLKTKNSHYNIDPCAKIKKIQIYYNCEMYDMNRKLKKIKTFLLNRHPVDILLIYQINNSNEEDLKSNYKKKSFKKTNNEIKNDNIENCVFKYDKHFKDKQKNKKNSNDSINNNNNNNNNKFVSFTNLNKLTDVKYSSHIYAKLGLIVNHINKIAIVDDIFIHMKNENHIILIKIYPK
ncbi:translation initiation factor IF-3, putative [Hepatocystis sp. ex Piliocolobus tephrosceles]|nr:translation initiation factor IF-3, putative [Hepatocystis sp. ex Piliocolobus tephrosceles]